jgi:hypothetical protein
MKKVTKKELEKVVEQQKELNKLLAGIGVLESQKHGLLHKVATLNKDIEEVKNDLEEKYGAVNINLEDGTYTKVEENE